jgi:hypothetical protein
VGPGDEDVNAIASKFFLPKGKMKTVQFKANSKLELYLELAHDRYTEILARIEGMDAMELEDHFVSSIYI